MTTQDEVDLYVRTYSTVLRSSGFIKLRALVPAHLGVRSSLHGDGASTTPDAGAFIYAIHRLPAIIRDVEGIVLGQLPQQFNRVLGRPIESWTKVSAPARRRVWHYDGEATLAVHIASPSDLDDVVPTLVAYEIEWNKLHALLNADPESLELLRLPAEPDGDRVAALGERLGFSADDWLRLRSIWGPEFWETLRRIGSREKELQARMLGGTHVGYAKLVRHWWDPIEAALVDRGLLRRPLYFVSSNLHGVVNLVSGYARRRADLLWQFLDDAADAAADPELCELRDARGTANDENILYYAARLWHQRNPRATVKDDRRREEERRGIFTITPPEGFDVGAQIVDFAALAVEDLDSRLGDLGPAIDGSSAVILNVDYPLGLAAYRILRMVAEGIADLRGVYVLGKAATLNGAVGDVMISDVIYDEHSDNVYTFENALNFEDVSGFLQTGSVFDNQKAATVKGTFLQNRASLDFYYRDHYTVVEMEGGPYLSAVYEACSPDRHPLGATIHLRHLPFDLGIVHYASDTPYTRARTLGGRSLSFAGIDSTYAATVAIVRRILTLELAHYR